MNYINKTLLKKTKIINNNKNKKLDWKPTFYAILSGIVIVAIICIPTIVNSI